MLDAGARWSWRDLPAEAPISFGELHVARRTGVHQRLVSGNLSVAGKAIGVNAASVGAFGLVTAPRYAVAIARDRCLVVSPEALLLGEGWDERGFAVTDVSDGLWIVDIAGPALGRLMSRAGDPALLAGSPSASIVFAGRPSLVYHWMSTTTLRVHMDRAYVPYITAWIAGASQLASAE
jgi:hypothetical protein